MRIQYILIHLFREWHKSDTKKDVKVWLRYYLDGRHLNAKNLNEFILIEATYPEDETKEDDIIFYEDGRYTLKGRTEATHYTGESLLKLIKEV